MLVNGFKFDIRFFLLIYCGAGKYLYTKGYNVYTKNKFNYNSMDKEKKINQIYTEDTHYTINKLPRTTAQLGKALNINFDIIIDSLSLKLKKVLHACNKLCCPQDKNTYHIYGIDVELLDNLEPIIIEINSNPSLTFHDEWKEKLIWNLKNDIYTKSFLSAKKDWKKIDV